MVEWIARIAQVLVALGIAYLAAFWFVLVVWTFRDIEARSRSVFTQVFSTLLAVLFFVPGVLLYLILRPKQTVDEAFQRSLEEEYLLQDLEELPLCPSCHRYVDDEFVLCPQCHAQLREPCASCSRLVDLRWPICPYCAAVQHGRGETGERVEPTPARWTAPALRRRRGAADATTRRRPAAAAFAEAPAIASNGHAAPRERERGEEARSLTAEIPALLRSLVRPFDRLLTRESKQGENSAGPATDSRYAAEVDGDGFTGYWEMGSVGDGTSELYRANGHADNGREPGRAEHPLGADEEMVPARPLRFARPSDPPSDGSAPVPTGPRVDPD